MKASPTAIHSDSLSDTAKRVAHGCLAFQSDFWLGDPALLAKDWGREKRREHCQLSYPLSLLTIRAGLCSSDATS